MRTFVVAGCRLGIFFIGVCPLGDQDTLCVYGASVRDSSGKPGMECSVSEME